MANNHSVQADQLTEGVFVLVRGKLSFARLTRIIDGDELVKSDQRRVQNGMRAIGKQHTTATVTEAEVLVKDPQNPTLEDRYVAERRYSSKARPETGANYSIQSKGTILPNIGIPDEQGQVVQDKSGKELASGLDVTLVLRVYKAKGQDNRGLGLDQVIVNEPVKYYTSASAVNTNELAARGIVWAAPPESVNVSDAAPSGDAAPVDGPDLSNGTQMDNGFAWPAPGNQPAAQPAPQAETAAAPAAASAPAAQPAAAQTGETVEQKLARLEQLEAEAAQRNQSQDAGSAVGAVAPGGNPWTGSDTAGQQAAGITLPG